MKAVTGEVVIEDSLTIIKYNMTIPVVMSEVNIRIKTTVRYSEGERVIEVEGYLVSVYGSLSQYVCLDDGRQRVLCIPHSNVLTMRTCPSAQECEDVILSFETSDGPSDDDYFL